MSRSSSVVKARYWPSPISASMAPSASFNSDSGPDRSDSRISRASTRPDSSSSGWHSARSRIFSKSSLSRSRADAITFAFIYRSPLMVQLRLQFCYPRQYFGGVLDNATRGFADKYQEGQRFL